MNTKQIIYGMLTENTGAHFLDSGGAYGRNHERNQNKTIEDFEREPEQSYVYNYGYIERRVSVFHYLSQLSTDAICKEFNQLPCNDHDANCDAYGISADQWQWLNDLGYVEIINTFNSYNGDSDLSQIIQGSWITINDEQYLLLQIHGGCDARGGYTDAKLFQTNEYYMIHEYLREYEDTYDIKENLEYGYIDVISAKTGKKMSNKWLLNKLKL